VTQGEQDTADTAEHRQLRDRQRLEQSTTLLKSSDSSNDSDVSFGKIGTYTGAGPSLSSASGTGACTPFPFSLRFPFRPCPQGIVSARLGGMTAGRRPVGRPAPVDLDNDDFCAVLEDRPPIYGLTRVAEVHGKSFEV